jgi:hypothetical protein
MEMCPEIYFDFFAAAFFLLAAGFFFPPLFLPKACSHPVANFRFEPVRTIVIRAVSPR